jgi:hypothetical protein
MDELRSAALKKTQEERPKTLAPHPILLDESGDETRTWDISNEEQTLIVKSSDTTLTSVFENVVTHVMKYNDLVDYVAIDINGTMFEQMDEDKTERTACNITEAWALSSYLVAELKQRVSTERWEQELLVLIKDGDTLFTIKNVDEADLYMELLENLQAIIVAGALFGIKVLMEVKEEPAATENSDFKNIIVFN